MKTSLLASAFFFTSLSAALASPFGEKPTRFDPPNTALSRQDNNRFQGIQTDGDRFPEIYLGGTEFMDVTAAPAGSGVDAKVVQLPTPDTDPYPANFPITWGAGRGDTADLDNDGDLDIVYSTVLFYGGLPEWQNVRVVACRNNGDGTWSRLWQLKVPSSPLQKAPEVHLADFDRDGDPDLLETSSGMVIRWNDGTGIFSTTSPLLHGVYPAMPGFSDTPVCEVGDFDANGWPDIALFGNVRLTTSDSQFAVTGRGTIYYNQDGDNFTRSTFVTNAALVKFIRTAQSDLDGDGRTDLLASRLLPDNSRDLFWYRNTGTSFTSGQLVHALTNLDALNEEAFAVGDIDEDGRTDILFSTQPDSAQWHRNSGGGVFAPAKALMSGVVGLDPVTGLVDIDGDGDLDIPGVSGRVVNFNRAPHLRSAANSTAFAGTALSGAVDLTTGDLNNDGVPDLIAADGGANRIRWYAAGAGGLTEQVFISTGSASPLSVAAGDWNRDGWTDIAWAGNNNIIRQGLSAAVTGTAWTFSDAANLTGVTGILPGDIDHDGDTDLLSWSSSGVLRIQANDGNAAWLPQGVDSAVTGINRAALGDTSPGGRQELVALGSTSLSHWIFSGSAWSKTQPVTVPAGTASRALCLGNTSDTIKGAEIIYSLNANSVYLTHYSLSQPQLLATFPSPVVQLTAVDWNHDGYTDILVTTTTGVSLLSHTVSADAEYEASPIALFTAPAGRTLQDTAVLELNLDGLPDAVTADSAGALHLLTNISYAVLSTMTSAASRTVTDDTRVEVARFRGSYQSRISRDAELAPARLVLSFNRAVGSPGAEVAGTPMTLDEITAVMGSMELRVSGAVYDLPSAGFGVMQFIGNGQFEMTLTNSIPSAIGPETPDREYLIVLGIKGTLENAPVTRFFITPQPAVSWVPAGTPPSQGVRGRYEGTSQRVLFTLREPTPVELWRRQYFGTSDQYNGVDGDNANDGDYDRDGIPNLVEYLTGRNPTVPDAAGDPTVNAFYDSGLATVVSDVRLLSSYDSRVKVTVQYSVDPTAGWGTVASRTGTGAWTGTLPYSVTAISGARTRYLFNKGISPITFPKAFYRIKAEEVP